MGVRVEFHADGRVSAHDPSNVRQKVAFAIIIAKRAHRSVHRKGNQIVRRAIGKLLEYLVAQRLINLFRDRSGRKREGIGSLNDLPPLLALAFPQHEEWGRHFRQRLRMTPRAVTTCPLKRSQEHTSAPKSLRRT